MSKLANLIVSGLIFLASLGQAWAWNEVGHRIVAQIALDNLPSKTIARLNAINQDLNHIKPYAYNLNYAAVWMDLLKRRNIYWYSKYHYIDIPFSVDNTPLPPVPEVNAVWAIQEALEVFKQKHPHELNRAFALRVLLHVVGDLHQPLHAAARISKNYPQGDKGGTLFFLGKNRVGATLHQYWDRGGGYLLVGRRHQSAKIKAMAKKLEAQWPCSANSSDNDPMHWADESHSLAKQVVYTLKPHTTPSKAYQQNAEILTQKRLALAGCRLAKLLGSLNHFGE